MALFQTSILRKYQNSLDNAKVSEAWQVFKNHFHNPEIQNNIRESNEEQYQSGFLNDLFVKVLGYIKNPEPNFTLTTEYKNVKDSKKADGAIIIDEKVLAVIELKGTNTTDLTKVETQAFGYKNNQPQCIYVITSNFEKLRFYIDNAIEHIEFNLFTLTKEEFKLLYLCLHFDQISKGIPKKMKDASVVQEEDVTKKLYKDYSEFKRVLFANLVERNPEYDSLEVFKKTQKLLDRFLFLFFSEDRGLIPPNSIRKVITDWKKLKELDAYVPLLDRFRQFFEYINSGYKGKDYEIYAYNGGLFEPDSFLDTITIDDELLYKHTVLLADYDFESEIDVNILGHIFENSLNEIDEIKAEIAGETIDRKQTKRKKDGVFYTPKYITKYIVENTVGELCEEKKEELKIDEENYYLRTRASKAKTELFEKLKTYREWLLQLTICDPACGSGAFLNQALDFLIAEHRYIDELQAKLFGDSLILSDIESNILENNLFGVDLNEESVDIAKLSLWLRTARPHRKLNDLSNNLKCGNSLIDDPEIAGDKAFNWEKEFPHVFAKGGFDVVIGNPPYGAKLDKETQNYLNTKYIKGGSETVISFSKLSYDLLLKDKGLFGFIVPKAFTFSSNYKSIREYLVNDIFEIVDCQKVWSEVLLEQVIFMFQKNKSTDFYNSSVLKSKVINKVGEIDKKTFSEFEFFLNNISNKELLIGQKVNSSKQYINDIANNSRGGMFQRHIVDDENLKVLGGAEIQREGIVKVRGYVKKEDIKNYPRSIINKNSILVQNIVAHIQNPFNHIKITACYPENRDYFILDTINQITFKDEYNAKIYWFLLNSKLINWYAYRFIYGKAIRTMHFDNAVTSKIPLPLNLSQQPFIEKADLMLNLHKDLQSIVSKFLALLESELGLERVSKKMQDWYLLSFGEFTAELKKQKINLSLAQKSEWMDFFEAEKAKATTIKSEIDQTDAEIDQMVYELYGLTDEEIAIVEGDN